MSASKIKAAKIKVHEPPDSAGADAHFHVYTFDVFNRTFLPGRTFDTAEKAAAYQRHEQERVYAEQEADPELFDLPFISHDPDLIARLERDSDYRARLLRDLTSEARNRARKR
ncbi:MAG: hypothetical protein HYR73_03825 [Candidatus Eisenbacteria bacterium]|nr:hypothetical protein [Candidatus Eisenbacteria bacterium]